MDPSARGFRGFSRRASRTLSEISLMTKPKADDAAMKMTRTASDVLNDDAARRAPNAPAKIKRIP
jgi:phage head maturation protease